jgi:hypothetical protein
MRTPLEELRLSEKNLVERLTNVRQQIRKLALTTPNENTTTIPAAVIAATDNAVVGSVKQIAVG